MRELLTVPKSMGIEQRRMLQQRATIQDRRNRRIHSLGGWPGYDPDFRLSIVSRSRVWIVEHAPSLLSSWKRWRRRLSDTRSLAPDAHGLGQPRRLTWNELFVLHAYKLAYPHATADECILAIAWLCGRVHERQHISGALRHLLNMSRQRVQVVPQERNENLVTLWHTQPPPVGHAGVHRRRIINVDEMGLNLLKVQRGYGHAVVGTRARSVQMSNPHVRYNIIAGISSTGELFYTINIENTDEAVFLRYLVNDLFPRIVDQQRVLMWDNLNVHLGPRVTAASHAAGHIPLPCAPYNQDESPVEFFFGEVEKWLSARCFEITRQNFAGYINRALVNVAATMNLNAVFRHCRL